MDEMTDVESLFPFRGDAQKVSVLELSVGSESQSDDLICEAIRRPGRTRVTNDQDAEVN